MNAFTERLREVLRTQEALSARLAAIIESAQKDDGVKPLARHAAYVRFGDMN